MYLNKQSKYLYFDKWYEIVLYQQNRVSKQRNYISDLYMAAKHTIQNKAEISFGEGSPLYLKYLSSYPHAHVAKLYFAKTPSLQNE